MTEAAQEKELSYIDTTDQLVSCNNKHYPTPNEVTLMQLAASWVTASEKEEKVQKPQKETRDHQGEVQGQ